MTSSYVLIITIAASTILWIALTLEFLKPSKQQNGRKIFILTTAGCLSTLVLTISLFQSLT